MKRFQVWKTINIGTYKNVEELKRAIKEKGFRIGSWAEDVLHSESFTMSKTEKKVDLVRITPSGLGFSNGAYRKDIYKKATEAGLEICPLEVGPQLRIQYLHQPRLESLQIGMESQFDSENHESQFRVVHGGDNFIWLVGDHKHLDDFWKGDEDFIFVQK
ncbi:MAG: hypothetical protein WD509_01380 [Candidatus Paceibacterota bacterium]